MLPDHRVNGRLSVVFYTACVCAHAPWPRPEVALTCSCSFTVGCVVLVVTPGPASMKSKRDVRHHSPRGCPAASSAQGAPARLDPGPGVGRALALSSSDYCFPHTLFKPGPTLSYSAFVHFSQFVLTHLHIRLLLNISTLGSQTNRQPPEDTQH